MKKASMLAALCGCAFFSFAQTAAQSKYPQVDIPYKKFVLDNGLTLIVAEDHSIPMASFDIWYHVGSKNEKRGKTGFAHLFEHLMFTSTEHWNNFDEIMQTVGGANNNGTTNNDRTNYFETFSTAGLDRVLWLESDRMGFLANGLDTTKVNVQRGVVQNEKRQGQNQPYSIEWDLTPAATYPAGHPYSWTVIGEMEDLEAASVADVKEWFRTYYGPNNAIVAIAGDVNTDTVLAKVKKYFADIPAGPPIAKFTSNIAKMEGTKQQVAQDRVPQPRLQKTWNIPGWGTQDVTYLSLLGDVLTTGKSSRLYKLLVYDKQLATDVSFYADDKEIGGQFYLIIDAKPDADVDSINTLVDAELKKVLTAGITTAELERAKINYFSRFLKGMERLGGFGGKADILAENETLGGSPDYYKTVQSWIKAATPAHIKSSAQQWLSDGEYVLKIMPYGNFSNTASNLDRSRMPELSKATPAVFPAVTQFTLSNGLKVALAERHSVPLVSMSAVVDAGYAADAFAQPGTAYMTGTMLTEGTQSKTALQISDALQSAGASLNAYSDLDDTYLTMNALKARFDSSLRIFADVLLHPSFPQNNFERVKKEQAISIQQEEAEPRSAAMRVISSLVFPAGHPYSNPLTGTGTQESLQNISRQTLQQFHQSWFAPNNTTLVVVGDITETELKAKLETYFAGWKQHEVPAKKVTPAPLAPASAVYVIDKPEAEQSYIYAAETAPPATDKNFDKITMMNRILGGDFVSRINMNLREDKHWSYGAGTRIYDAVGQSLFYVSAPVQTDKTKESLEELKKELTGVVKDKPVTDKEFMQMQTSALSELGSLWETNGAVRNFLMNALTYNRGSNYLSNYYSLLQNMTVSDMKTAVQDVVKPQNLTWIIVGDKAKIGKDVEAAGLGTVHYINAQGKEVK